MTNEHITKKQFIKYISAQPFFIWNSLEHPDEQLEDGEIAKFFWSDKVEEAAEASYGEIAARTISKMEAHVRAELIKNHDYLIITGDKEAKIEMTKKNINSGKLLIDPVFEYRGALAQPFAYDTNTSTIVDIKYSRKTSLKDLMNFYYNYSIISKGNKVKGCELLLPRTKVYKKGEIDFQKINVIHKTKSGKTPFEVGKNGKSSEVVIIDFCKSPDLAKNVVPSIDVAIDAIEKAKDAKLTMDLTNDVENILGNNEWNKLMEELKFKYANYNGFVIKKKDVKEYFENKLTNSEDINMFYNPVLKQMDKAKETKSSIIKEHAELHEIKMIDEASKVVWYDFEGYSLPISPLDGVSPYAQVVFQVSVIVTENNIEKDLRNVVIDPKTIGLDDLYRIIEEVYSGGADAYVVYNQGYEIPRMREIVTLLRQDNHPKAAKAEEMFNVIEANTVDLMKLFKTQSQNKVPQIMMYDQYAKASIKNIEKHISKNGIQVPRPIKQYANLVVQNGGMAMEEAINRSLELTGDKLWESKVDALKEYCENDVRAMIMVYDFVKGLLNGAK